MGSSSAELSLKQTGLMIMAGKTPENLLRIIAALEPLKSDLAAPREVIAQEMFEHLDPAMTAAQSDAEIDHLIREHLRIRPHYFKPKSLAIPRDELEAAFGDVGTDATRLSKQGELVKRYLDERVPGQPEKSSALEAAAARWGAKVGSPKPGLDPDQTHETKRAAPEKNNFGIEPSKNPYSPAWRAPRAPKDEADREAQRQAAYAHLFKTFGAKNTAAMALAHGKQIDGRPLRKVGAR